MNNSVRFAKAQVMQNMHQIIPTLNPHLVYVSNCTQIWVIPFTHPTTVIVLSTFPHPLRMSYEVGNSRCLLFRVRAHLPRYISLQRGKIFYHSSIRFPNIMVRISDYFAPKIKDRFQAIIAEYWAQVYSF